MKNECMFSDLTNSLSKNTRIETTDWKDISTSKERLNIMVYNKMYLEHKNQKMERCNKANMVKC